MHHPVHPLSFSADTISKGISLIDSFGTNYTSLLLLFGRIAVLTVFLLPASAQSFTTSEREKEANQYRYLSRKDKGIFQRVGFQQIPSDICHYQHIDEKTSRNYYMFIFHRLLYRWGSPAQDNLYISISPGRICLIRGIHISVCRRKHPARRKIAERV